jgi:hypothetical protein
MGSCIRRAGPVRPCRGVDRPSRRRRLLREALLASVATVLLTGVALAAPQVLRQSPITTIRQLAAPILPGLAPADPAAFSDCP